MSSFWRDIFGFVHLPKGPLYVEEVKRFGERPFKDITPLDLPEIKPLHATIAKKPKQKKLKPPLPMRRSG